MTAHRQECKLQLVRCKHASEGCKEMIRRKSVCKDNVIHKLCTWCNMNINSSEREFHYSSCDPMNLSSSRTGTNR